MANIGQGFDVDGFRALIQRKGVAKNNLYKVLIAPPRGLVAASDSLNMPKGSDIEDIMLYCDEVTLPGISLVTSDSRPYGYGPVELKAYAPAFNNLQATFIVDTQSYTLSFFRNWMRGIVNYSGEGQGITSSRINGALPFEASFKSEYETTMEILLLDNVGGGGRGFGTNVNIVSKTTVLRAFPIEIGSLMVGYGNNDSYMRLPVTFNFFEWYSDNLSNASTNPLAGQTGVAGAGNNNGSTINPSQPAGDNPPSDVNSNPAFNASTQFN